MNFEEQKARSIHRGEKGPCILLGSGAYFDFLDPENADVTIEDYAYGLAAATRFAGQTRSRATGKRVFYNTAQHCVELSYIVPPHLAYQALMHEAGEPWCGDMVGPLKSICPDFKKIEKNCEAAVQKKFGVVIDDPDLLKNYDMRMWATEIKFIMPHDEENYRNAFEPFEDVVIVPDDSQEISAQRFLARYYELSPLFRNYKQG